MSEDCGKGDCVEEWEGGVWEGEGRGRGEGEVKGVAGPYSACRCSLCIRQGPTDSTSDHYRGREPSPAAITFPRRHCLLIQVMTPPDLTPDPVRMRNA